jgi:hypothetical protein
MHIQYYQIYMTTKNSYGLVSATTVFSQNQHCDSLPMYNS